MTCGPRSADREDKPPALNLRSWTRRGIEKLTGCLAVVCLVSNVVHACVGFAQIRARGNGLPLMLCSVTGTPLSRKAVRMSWLCVRVPQDAIAQLSCFRADFYDSLTSRADALFELTDSLLCADGPVKTLVGLALEPEHRRGHGALYGGLNRGRIGVARLRRCWPR